MKNDLNIVQNLQNIKRELPSNVTLVAVSKTKSEAEILEAYKAGHRNFGENKVQEMTAKWECLPKDIKWHMIGHVQRNKVKYMAPFVSLIHGVDSLRLLKEIDRQGQRFKRIIPCLLQIHIAREENKFGFADEEVREMIASPEFKSFTHIKVEGLMGMATFTDDHERIRKEFKGLKELFEEVKEILPEVHVLSMGMSNDFTIAIEEGANMVRIGSRIFGQRY